MTSTRLERPSAATSRENPEQADCAERTGGELAAAPCSASSVPMVLQAMYDYEGKLPPPYFDAERGVQVVPCDAVKRTFHVSEIEQLDDSYGDKSRLRKLAEFCNQQQPSPETAHEPRTGGGSGAALCSAEGVASRQCS